MSAVELAERTADAYSAGAFGTQWLKTAKMLLARGYTEAQAEAILRSKWTRWCRDAYSNANEGRAEYLEKFLDDPRNRCTIEAVNEMVEA